MLREEEQTDMLRDEGLRRGLHGHAYGSYKFLGSYGSHSPQVVGDKRDVQVLRRRLTDNTGYGPYETHWSFGKYRSHGITGGTGGNTGRMRLTGNMVWNKLCDKRVIRDNRIL